MGLEIIKYEDCNRDADAIAAAGLLARQLRYPSSKVVESVAERRRRISQERLEAVERGELVLLGTEEIGTYTAEDIYALEEAGAYVEPTAWGVRIYGPSSQN